MNGKPAPPFRNLNLDLATEVVCEGKVHFEAQPDRKEYPTIDSAEYWFHVAMLVIWPTELSLLTACVAGVSGALDLLEKRLETSYPNFKEDLDYVLGYCEKYPVRVWGGYRASEDSVTPRLISLCTREKLLNDVFYELVGKAYNCRYVGERSRLGVSIDEDAEAIASAVQVFGWEAISAYVIVLVGGCALTQDVALAQLAGQLISKVTDMLGQLWQAQHWKF